MATILEALQNADFNLDTIHKTGMVGLIPLAKDQIHNAATLLEKGYSPYVEIEPLLEQFKNIENVPDALDYKHKENL